MKLLLVEDERELAQATQALLEKNNYVVDLADSIRVAQAALLDNSYGVILLDRRLPDGDGTELIAYAQRKKIQTRFLVISAMGDIEDLVAGLNLGADDYVVKPYDPNELLARIKAALRRPVAEEERTVTVGNLRLNQESREFFVNDVPMVLPRRELTILELLTRRAGRVVTRDDLEAELYGYDEMVESNTLATHVSRLRKSLKEHGVSVEINVIRGVGYYLRSRA
jgi:DNA-binding response OmpR family regulator